MSKAFSNFEQTTSSDRVSDVGPSRAEQEQTIARLKRLAGWMDSAFEIPGTSYRIGLDSLIGLVPGIGDLITSVVSAEFVRQAIKMGARKRIIAQMVGNIGLDLLVGAVPLLGDIFDVAFKSNSKNAKLLENEFLRETTVEGQVLHSNREGNS